MESPKLTYTQVTEYLGRVAVNQTCQICDNNEFTLIYQNDADDPDAIIGTLSLSVGRPLSELKGPFVTSIAIGRPVLAMACTKCANTRLIDYAVLAAAMDKEAKGNG